MKTWGLAAVLLAAPVAFAASDLAVISLSSDKTIAQAAEPVTLTTRVANLGPDEATNVVAFILFSGYPMKIVAPAGWTCGAEPFEPTSGVGCTTPQFAAGAEAEFRVRVLDRPTGGTRYTAEVRSPQADPVTTNNTRTLSVTRTAAESRADLAVSTPETAAGPLGQPTVVRASVTNHGPSSVSKVHLVVYSYSLPDGVQVNGSGSDWRCTSYGDHLECERPSLAAGETAFVDVSFGSTAPLIVYYHFAAVAERNDDPVSSNDNWLLRKIGLGNATDWKMFLLPLDAEAVQGVGGSLWITEITMLLRSETTVDLRPELCDHPIFDCTFPAPPPPPPVNEPFNYYLGWNETLGQYFYVPAEDAHKVSATIRIYDASRTTSTGGAEIPVVSEDQFATGTVSLLGVPLDGDNRYTLRVYDADGRGGRVAIHVYAQRPFDGFPTPGGQETTPRKTIVATLVPGGSVYHTTTSALLPINPATLQINPLDGIDLEGIHRVRIDVEPLDPGMRLWSFVSITNNETHHVTTVSQN